MELRRGKSITTNNLLQSASLWPSLALDDILRYVARSHTAPREWSKVFIDFAKLVTMMQKLCRLALASSTGDTGTVSSELHNIGPSDASMERFPSWVLVEIDADFMIRPLQERVALGMTSPSL